MQAQHNGVRGKRENWVEVAFSDYQNLKFRQFSG